MAIHLNDSLKYIKTIFRACIKNVYLKYIYGTYGTYGTELYIYGTYGIPRGTLDQIKNQIFKLLVVGDLPTPFKIKFRTPCINV